MQKSDSKVLLSNTIMMYLMSIAKIVIPLVSMPYLVRVLSVDCYGSVSFVKSIISYMQVVIDFGFGLSATKDIVLLIKNKGNVNKEISNTFYAQLLLSSLCFVFYLVLVLFFDNLDGLELYTFLYVLNVVLSIGLFEYVFRAYQQMGKISVRYIIMKVLSLVLTLIFVKNDNDIILMPIFELIATVIALIMVWFQLKKMNVKIKVDFKDVKSAFRSIKISCVYFFSSFATTAFTLLNTFLIGMALSKADCAYWSITSQMVSVVQCLYDPIISSVFPQMVTKKDLRLIFKILLIYMPLIFAGCVFILLFANPVVSFVFTEEYLISAKMLKQLIPLLIVSFVAMLYGWPCLGCINKQKVATISTVIAAGFQVAGLILLGITHHFTLKGLIIVRNLTEIVLCVIRIGYVYGHRKLFTKNVSINEFNETINDNIETDNSGKEDFETDNDIQADVKIKNEEKENLELNNDIKEEP